MVLFFSLSSCSGPGVLPVHIDPSQFKPPESNGVETIKPGEYVGCKMLPRKTHWYDKFRFANPPANYSGESCTITITEDQKVSVSFVPEKELPIHHVPHTNLDHANIDGEKILGIWHGNNGVLHEVSYVHFDKNNPYKPESYNYQQGKPISDCSLLHINCLK